MSEDRKFYYPKNACRHHVAFNHKYRLATSAETGQEYLPRQDVMHKSTVFDLVYRYLRKIAERDRKWKQRNCACDKFHRQHARRKDIREPVLTTTLTDLDAMIGDSNERLKSQTGGRALATAFSSSRSSNECIADYVKAVRDGRRRTKLYIRDALLYGLQSGLLIPTNRQRNELRVSRKLDIFSPRNLKEDEEDRSSIATRDTEYFE